MLPDPDPSTKAEPELFASKVKLLAAFKVPLHCSIRVNCWPADATVVVLEVFTVTLLNVLPADPLMESVVPAKVNRPLCVKAAVAALFVKFP